MEDSKTYTLYAGVNGAGKSTIYDTISLFDRKNYVNSDEILVSNGGDWKNEQDQIKAGLEAVKKISHYIECGISFEQETTLAGRTIIRSIKKAKEKGFYINLYYIGLENAEIAVDRVRNRVARGGHGIDENLIRKRYDVSLATLKEITLLCDTIVIYDNSDELIKVARYQDGRWTVYYKKCVWFNKIFPGLQYCDNDTLKYIQEENKKGATRRR